MIEVFLALVIFNFYPGIDNHEIGHEARDVAFHDRRIPPQYILVHNIHRITLEHD